MGWCLPGCAILLSDLSRGGCLLLDSAQCNLSTLKKKKKKKKSQTCLAACTEHTLLLLPIALAPSGDP